jgi:hypothetical protein
VRKYPDNPRCQLDAISSLDLDNGENVLVSRQILWAICSPAAKLPPLLGQIEADIHRLEQETGREWCYRSGNR